MQDIQAALKTFLEEWHTWCKDVRGFRFAELTPMHAGWKVPDEPSLGQKITELLPLTTQGHIGTVDNRKIVLLVPAVPVAGIPILQIMQLRPGSKDSLGLDHVAFIAKIHPLCKLSWKSLLIFGSIRVIPGMPGFRSGLALISEKRSFLTIPHWISAPMN
jgi:hypothetical protein